MSPPSASRGWRERIVAGFEFGGEERVRRRNRHPEDGKGQLNRAYARQRAKGCDLYTWQNATLGVRERARRSGEVM